MKPTDELEELKAKLGAALQAELEALPVSRRSFLSVMRSSSARDAQLVRTVNTLRKKLIDRRLWHHRLEPLLADEYLRQLVSAGLKRRERAAADRDQLTLPGFENLPRRMHVAQLSVGIFLLRAGRYEKRANRNRLAAEEMQRLATLIRDQPPEISVPEAVARAMAPASSALGR